MHPLIVGVLLTGEVHLFCVDILHHHTEVARACQAEHHEGTYLHTAQDLTPLCPLCQIMRSGSVRPAVPSVVQELQHQFTYQPTARPVGYSHNLAQSLLARAPPLS